MTEAFAPVPFTASCTVSNTGRSRCFVPPFPGVTPPTTFVPYSIICCAWKVPSRPVKPCTMRRVFSFPRPPHPNRDFFLQVFGCRHNSRGENIAAQDSAKDIDEHCLHSRIANQNAEGVF